MSQVFRTALPGQDARRGKVDQMGVDNRYPSPKIDTAARPPHAGIIFLNWSTTTPIAFGTTKLVHWFPHGYDDYVPTAIASYKFDNGTSVLRGTLPFQYSALGVITIDADKKSVNVKYQSTDFFGLSNIPAFTMQIRFYVMAERGYS